MVEKVSVRRAGPVDEEAVLGLADAAMVWLVERGRTGQWGSKPWSDDPARVEAVRGMLSRNEPWMAQVEGRPAGILILADRAPEYVPAAGRPELYVLLLITARAHAGLGVGGLLLDFARQRARERGIGLLRVDCWRGGDGNLVSYYESQGFTPTAAFDYGGWPGQVLEQDLAAR